MVKFRKVMKFEKSKSRKSKKKTLVLHGSIGRPRYGNKCLSK